MKRFAWLVVVLGIGVGSPLRAATSFTQWTFEGDVITPATGSGTASLVGGTSSTFATSGAGRGWNTASYAPQGTESGQRGVQFLASTVGYQDIVLTFDQRASGTASRWAQVDYTLDGIGWIVGFWNNGGGLSPHDSFYPFSVDFSGIAAANNNAQFGVRIVSIFSPLAFDQNATLPDYGAGVAYMRANSDAKFPAGTGVGTGDYGTTGTWRFDNVTFTGNAIPEPSRAMLLLIGGLGLLHRRRWVAR